MDVMPKSIIPASTLLSLPVELIVHILAHLSCPDLLACRCTTRLLHTVIDSDTLLLYLIELYAAGMQDNPASGHVLADKYRLLKEKEHAWQRLNFSCISEIKVPHNPSSIYDLTGGVFLLGESYSRLLPTWRATDAVRYINLWDARAQETGPKDVLSGPWKQLDVHTKIMDVGIAAQEHDLMAAVTYSFPDAYHFAAAVTIHLLKLSTGQYHPAAKQAILHVPSMPFMPGNCSVSIEIVGDTLGALFNLSRFLHGTPPVTVFYLYDWKTGRLKLTRTADQPKYNAFCFLSPDIIVLPSVHHNEYTSTLELCSLTSPAGAGADSSPLQTICILDLPRPSVRTMIHRIWCRAEPNAMATSAGTFARVPFFSDPSRAVIIFNIVAQDMAEGNLHYLSMVVHRESLLACLERVPHEHPQGTATARARSPRSPALGGLGESPRLPWDAWGPPTCLWLDGDDLAIRWITVTCGQRFVVMSRDAPAPIQVYDFNPRVVKRLMHAAGHMLVKETRDRSYFVDPESKARLVFVKKDTLLSTIFEGPVVSELPYVVVATHNSYHYESVMIDEGMLIGVQLDEETDNIGTLFLHTIGPAV